ncbi:MAG: hypothetical protein ACRDGS_07550 [Chloroflexota bacterium]
MTAALLSVPTPTTADAGTPEYIGIGGWPPMKDWTTSHRRLAAQWSWQRRKDARLQACRSV